MNVLPPDWSPSPRAGAAEATDPFRHPTPPPLGQPPPVLTPALALEQNLPSDCDPRELGGGLGR